MRSDELLEHEDYIITEERDGTRHAINRHFRVTVLPDGPSKLAHRRELDVIQSQARINSGVPVKRSALVAKLDDVWVFIKGNQIIITKQNISLV